MNQKASLSTNVLRSNTNHNVFTKVVRRGGKDAKNEVEYEEYSVTHEVRRYFNII